MGRHHTTVLAVDWLPDGMLSRWKKEFADCQFLHVTREDEKLQHLADAEVIYGFPPLEHLGRRTAPKLRWLQLASAGVPRRLCPLATEADWLVTNLAGLYGPSIAEHALALIIMLARQLHIVVRQQQERRWDRSMRSTMIDLAGRTLAVIGLGNIGRNIARLAKAHGMQVVGCRRTGVPTPGVDRVYPCSELHAMLAVADFLAVAAPLVPATEAMLGAAEFQAMKRGVFYVNVSRGAVAEEQALLDALRSGQVAGAALDAFAVEPLPEDHPFWGMPQVIISPHYSGETVNTSALPAERFMRNLRAWQTGGQLEGVVSLEHGY
jgi:phosphoglycerate dehydrogenase-like enzyme